MKRVKRGIADAFWMNLGFMWISIGRVMSGQPPLFDTRGYHFTQPQFQDPRYTIEIVGGISV